jgi:hypothetical protein
MIQYPDHPMLLGQRNGEDYNGPDKWLGWGEKDIYRLTVEKVFAQMLVE